MKFFLRRSLTIVSPAKTVEPIEMSFIVGPRNHVLDGGHIGATWRIRVDRVCAAWCQITLTLVVQVTNS